ncbi:MAG: hypothetical protein M1836_005250 [Candelina mexicana]|nr:MAG: hypothetical protein M1836_005250 [Candelina mexicana]
MSFSSSSSSSMDAKATNPWDDDDLSTTTESSSSAPSSTSSTSTRWHTFRRNFQQNGIWHLADRRLLITKTEEQLDILAEGGQVLIETNASESQCSNWLATLLPPLMKKLPLICRNSEFLSPGVIPEGPDHLSELIWTRMKPGSIWFYKRSLLSSSAWKAYKATLDQIDTDRRPYAAISLNAEQTSCGGSAEIAQAQAIAAAVIALCERIQIRQSAAQESSQQPKSDQLAQYFFVFLPTDIQLWRLTKTDDHEFEAWQLDLDGPLKISVKSDLKRFIEVWNRLISNLLGPVFQSLKSDLEEIADKREGDPRTTRKRKVNEAESDKSNKKPCVEKAEERRTSGRLAAKRGKGLVKPGQL